MGDDAHGVLSHLHNRWQGQSCDTARGLVIFSSPEREDWQKGRALPCLGGMGCPGATTGPKRARLSLVTSFKLEDGKSARSLLPRFDEWRNPIRRGLSGSPWDFVCINLCHSFLSPFRDFGARRLCIRDENSHGLSREVFSSSARLSHLVFP